MVTAVELKRFVSKALNIPQAKLRAQGGSGWCEVRIIPEKGKKWDDPLTYSHLFPPEWGNRCMRIVYASSETLSAQNWGGNITSHSIAMSAAQWQKFMEQTAMAAVTTDLVGAN